MKFQIENGTDGACMALYDRTALPENYDVALEDDDASDIFELQDEAKCAVIGTDGDGSYWLHLYLNESAPEINQKYVMEHTEMQRLMVPSGSLYYTGCEYISYCDTDFSNKYPAMIGTIEIPKGDYKVDIYFMQYPDTYLKAFLDSNSSGKNKLILTLHKLLGYLSLVGIFTAFVIASSFGILGVIISLIPLACWFATFWTPPYAKADDERERILSQLPNIVAELNG